MNPSQEYRFGSDALRLGARVCGAAWPSRSSRLLVRSSALSGAEHRRLADWGARLGTSTDGSQTWIEPDPEALELAAQDDSLAARLWEVLEACARPFAKPVVMGILNVTPDSFSDGGLHASRERALEAGLRMVREGAEWIDVGGESTRPGAVPVPLEEELRRVVPVIEDLRSAGCEKISVDTRHAAVAAAALEAGASLVNDVGAGLDDEDMLAVVRDAGCKWVLMHRQGSPADMQRAPEYRDVVAEVNEFLRARVATCLRAGVEESALWIDPGIGFGKRLEHNLDLLKRLSELRSLGLPILVGPSRKAFIGHITGSQAESDWKRRRASDDPSDRIGGTAAAITFCVAGGADVLRVHDVPAMAEAVAVAGAITARPTLP